MTRIAQLILSLPGTFWLILCGVLNTLIFHFAFGARYSLALYWDRPFQSIGTLNRFSPEGALIYAGAFGLSFLFYWLGYRLAVRRTGEKDFRLLWPIVVGLAGAMLIVLLPMYPTDAADLYDYIIRGRMTAYYSLNPLSDVPRALPDDPFFRFVGWKDVPSAYGGAWELIAAAATRLAGDENIPNLIAFKLVSVLGFGLTALFIVLTLAELARHRRLVGLYLFAWNPLVIYMVGGRGHNDSLLTACIALGFYLLARAGRDAGRARFYVGAGLALLLGALIKFIPALLLPLVGLVALRDLPDTRTRLRFLGFSAAFGLILVVVSYGPFWTGFETLRADRRASMYTGSIATIVRQTLAPSLDNKSGETWLQDTPNTNRLVSGITAAIFLAFYGLQLLRVYRDRDPLRPARSAALILTCYLLVAALWFQSWYVMWVVALVALLDDTPLRRFVLAFSYLVTWQTLIYNYLTLRPGQFAPLPWRDLVPVVAFMGMAWALLLWYWIAIWMRRGRRNLHDMHLGDRLRAVRTAANLSAERLAYDLRISTDQLLDYEDGLRSIPVELLRVWSARFGLRLDEVIGVGPGA